MDVSAVVLSFNSAVYIEKCVHSLFEAYEQAGLEGEVLVTENGSTDGSVEKLKALQNTYGDKLTVFYLSDNTGTTYSRNLGLDKSRGKFVLVLDSDAYMNADALKGMVEFLQSHPEYGMVAPKLTYPDGRFQLSYDVFPTLGRKIQRFFLLKKIESAEPTVECTQSTDIDYAISACWLFPRTVYENIGGLDENIFYAPEDVDYCLRVWKSGKKIAYLPEFSVVHDAQEKSRGIKFNYFTYLHVKGLIYYFIKHRYVFGLSRLYQAIKRF